MSKTMLKNIISSVAIGIIALLVIFGIYGVYHGWFRDMDGMREFVARAGPLGPLAFLVIQILQVVLPLIPGGVTLMTGVVIFGPVWGFVLNYLGVVIGSVINFVLARKYGKSLVTLLVSEETYNKYIGKLENGKTFERFFAFAILMPFFPDDTLCLMVGLTKMPMSKFMMIILLGKPPTIVSYSFIFVFAGHLFLKMM